MLVFLEGVWHDINLPFSDPLLTEDHKRWAAARVARYLAKGYSQRQATDLAEKALLERIYGGSSGVARKEHHTPQH